ncbi:hypothetical protein [Phaeacidiphilus oryzae]|uniref:hypothetical protein n=1 Tax=Phaeacidiphilus oryzae TaxID=348818 RepID=UPI0005680602|nr:hypothetical protein [Phaeacidiphilus oryzae]
MDQTNDKNDGNDENENKGRKPQSGDGRRAERIVFDDPLSAVSADDTDRGWGERPSSAGRDDSLDWYLRERPPHHGD